MISIPREIPIPYQYEGVDVSDMRSHWSSLMIGTKVFATLREFNTAPFSSTTRHLLVFDCLLKLGVTENGVTVRDTRTCITNLILETSSVI